MFFKKIQQLEGEVLKLQVENLALKEQLKKLEGFIDLDIGDPAPSDVTARREYVATVAAVYQQILEPKFKQCISSAHRLMEPEENDRDYDMLLKGSIFMLRDLMQWGKQMVNENVANNHINNTETEEPSS